MDMRLPPVLISSETIGVVAALCTTLCWIPQSLRILRTRNTHAISMAAQIIFTIGTAFWLAYGLLIGSLPVIGANAVTFMLASAILTMKIIFR